MLRRGAWAAPQRVELIDEVMDDAPEPVFVTRQGCEPWEHLAVMLMLRWPNLHDATSTSAPKDHPRAIIDDVNTRGADRLISAGCLPLGLSRERIMTELPSVRPKLLGEHAVRVLGLDRSLDQGGRPQALHMRLAPQADRGAPDHDADVLGVDARPPQVQLLRRVSVERFMESAPSLSCAILPHVKRSALGSLACAAILLHLAACGGDDGASPTVTDSATPGAAVTEAPPATGAPEPGAEFTDPPATDASTAPSPATSCPEGTWYASAESLQGFYNLVGERSGVTFTVEGGVLLVLAKGASEGTGTFEWRFQSYRNIQSVAGTTTEVTFTGVIGGTYSTDGTRLAITITDPDVTAHAVVNGTPVDASAMVQGFLTQFPLSNATFACEGSDLVVSFEVLGSTAPVRMVPA